MPLCMKGRLVDEFVVPANARFDWFSGTNIVKDRAPTISEYNVDHASTLIAQASPFIRFPEEFLCWVGISRNYLLNKDTYHRFEYEDGEEMDLNAFIRTADPRKVRVVERARIENEKPIVTVAKHRTVTLLPTLVPCPSRELSASIEREFVEDAGGSGGGDQEVASVGGHEKRGLPADSEVRVLPALSHQLKRLRADYGKIGGSVAGGKSPSVLNRLLQDSRLMVEQGVPALPTLPFITSSVIASPLEEGGDHTDSSSLLRSDDWWPNNVTAFVSNVATTTATPVDVGKDKDVPTPSVFAGSSSSYKTDRTLSLFTGRSGSDFVARSIRAGGAEDVDSQEIYIPECINILEKRKWKSLTEEKNNLLQVKDKEIEELSLEAIEGFTSEATGLLPLGANGLLEQEYSALKFKSDRPSNTSFLEKECELSDLGTSSSSLRSQNQSLVNQVHELETLSAGLREKLETLDEIDLSTYLGRGCCMHIHENFHLHLLNAIAGRRWLLTHGMKLLMAKCLNSTEYMEALGNDFGHAIEKWMQEGLAWNLNMDKRGMMVLNDCGKSVDGSSLLISKDKVVIGSQALSPSYRLSFDHSPGDLNEPYGYGQLFTNGFVNQHVIRPDSDPFLLVEDYENPDLAGAVPEDVIPGPKGEGKVGGSTEGDVDVGDLVLSQLENEARDAVL
ncbi:hypothetical protein Tco_1218915 [Tanacetum coccineum]